MKMKNILILAAFFASVSLSSVNAKESLFDVKQGVLTTPCVNVSGDRGQYDATFKQRGNSFNFELITADPSEDCLPESIEPLELVEGDACEITEDISDSVDFGVDCDNEGIVCTATQVVDGIVNEDGVCDLPEVEATDVDTDVDTAV